MRLFVALVPPVAVLDEIAAEINRLRPAAPDLRWSKRDQWHVTLVFLGEVEERRTPGLAERLGRAAHRHEAFELSFSGGGRFTHSILWAGVGGDRDRLRALAGSVAAAARRAGVDLADRTYRPHLTLARSRARGDVDLRPLVASVADFAGTTWRADAIHLIQSRLGANPTYTTLKSWPLGAARAGGGTATKTG
jgi:RNA 2',3'-cyclic 3'-phosphodiesterase